MAKKNQRGLIEMPDKNIIDPNRIVSVVRLGQLFILLDKKGRSVSYTELNADKQGKTGADADDCTSKIIESSKTNPFMSFGNGNYVRCSAIEAIENSSGPEYKGLIIRGEGDAILAFLAISTAEKRDLAVSKLHAARESYEHGKFMQPDLAGIF
ncbi:hypothetical protein [Vibrio parahaemolyticus]|uniref:hypothetical protein n=1 Tax=Vibrio parahaemolyticus TaxID=670 RepID=UPI003892BAC5